MIRSISADRGGVRRHECCEGSDCSLPYKNPLLEFQAADFLGGVFNDAFASKLAPTRELAAGSAPDSSNAVALCPNYHRRCHHSSDRDEFTASLFKKVEQLKFE